MSKKIETGPDLYVINKVLICGKQFFFFLICCFICLFSHAGVGKGISVTESDAFCQTTLPS